MMTEAVTKFGGFPSGREDVSVRQMHTQEMQALYNALYYNDPDLFLAVIQNMTDANVYEMEDDDFRYLLALFDKVSYTDDTRTITWRCLAPRWVKGTLGQAGYDYTDRDPQDPHYHKSTCGSLVTNEVRFRVKTVGKRHNLPHGIRHPLVKTYPESVRLIEEGVDRDLVEIARWVDTDLPLITTLHEMTLSEIAEVRRAMYSCIEVQKTLQCNFCSNNPTISEPLSFTSYLRIFSEISMMNMEFNLNVHFGAVIPNSIPLKKLLYMHGCYVQDKREADKKRRERQAKGAK